jgi:hypothetical protein
MSEHKVTLKWERAGAEFSYQIAFWFRAAEIACLPWSGLAQMMMLPLTVASTPPQLSSPNSSNNPSGRDDA